MVQFLIKCFSDNPSDTKWLQTALLKGTSKDRANAGALLVQANPLPNLSALDSLIALTKHSNKTNVDVFDVVTDLFINSLLPSDRKLISLKNRGNDWKVLRNSDITKESKDKVYAAWSYENELKELYYSFLLNLQSSLQNGKEATKLKAIIAVSKLLKCCPEREDFLLTILVNKFGDPERKVASKASYHLHQILLTHPNMAAVMVVETEKLIFRKNITEQAQQYCIGFLSLIAPIASVQTSQKLLNICFSFFKIKIEKGEINSKTMQSILRCLRVSIQNINGDKTEAEITTPDVVNTIYRLIYLSNISIALQALSLLLQLVLIQNENHDRFYNALYRKMVDPEIVNANNKITSLYFHIVHLSIQNDSNAVRAKAFIKRLLQMTLSFHPGKACGALIVVNKVLNHRPELMSRGPIGKSVKVLKHESSAFEDNSDDEEMYNDVKFEEDTTTVQSKETQQASSWLHREISTGQKISTHSQEVTKYDPFKRAAGFCGSEFSNYYEFLLMLRHFHPTVQAFIGNILAGQKIKYFGDPLKDFSLSHFLERFSFKNPKKKSETKSQLHQDYRPKGSRGHSVHLLTAQTCTEDEKFIFEFLQRKREIREKTLAKFDDEKESDLESVDDDEFDAYLDSMGAAKDLDRFDKEFDYLSELQEDPKGNRKNKKKPSEEDSEPESWDSEEEDSKSFSENETDSSQNSEDDEYSEKTKFKKNGQTVSDKSKVGQTVPKTSKKQSVFAPIDEFSEIIEKNTSDSHGTLGEIFNKDKSSLKQLNWEQKRHNDSKGFKRKYSSSKSFSGTKMKKKRY